MFFIKVEYMYKNEKEKATFKQKANNSIEAIENVLIELSRIDDIGEYEIINIFISHKV